MTVIVYRDGVMAADSGGFSGGTVHSHAIKIARGSDGTLYGVTGRASEATAFLSWVRAGASGLPPDIRRSKPDEGESAFSLMRVRPGGPIEIVDAYGVEQYEPDAPYAAIGAAAEAALGALYVGASALKAVEAAVAHSQWASGPVRTISHDG